MIPQPPQSALSFETFVECLKTDTLFLISNIPDELNPFAPSCDRGQEEIRLPLPWASTCIILTLRRRT